MSKLDLGTIKNGSAASDLPPEGPKKKSWADLTHLAHISKLALGTIKNGSAVSDLPPEGQKKKRWADLRNGGQKCRMSESAMSVRVRRCTRIRVRWSLD